MSSTSSETEKPAAFVGRTDRTSLGEGAGLETVAGAIGFEWDVDDPGGADSMVTHRDAVLGDEGAREWLLEYNRGDVAAAVREWMVGGDLIVDIGGDLDGGKIQVHR